MSRLLKRWLAQANTLSFRLFVGLWLALVLAHYVGYGVTSWLGRDRPDGHSGHEHASGISSPMRRSPVDNAGRGPHHGPGQPPGPHTAPPLTSLPIADGLPPPGHPIELDTRLDLPWRDVMVDYGTRLLIFALAAWLIARGVAGPLKRLSEAADRMDAALMRGQEPDRLDERRGPQEMRETARVFNDMARRLVSQFEDRSMLMAAVSHDVRTPLTRLRLRLEQVDDPALKAAQASDLAEIDQLVSQVLDALRQERAQERASVLDLWSLLQSVVDDLAEQGASISLRGERQKLQVLAEPQALRRVLDNLMGNALCHGHRAQVSVMQGDAGVTVLIDDEGPGIPPEHLEAVFKPFFRLDAARSREGGGVGLGLYIARQLALRQGLSLSLANRPQGGLRAALVWPAA